MKPSPAHQNTAATHHNYAEKMETSTESLKRKDPLCLVKKTTNRQNERVDY